MSARKKQQTVVFETSFNGRSIKKQLTFSPGTYIIGLEVVFENPEQYISRGTYSLSWSGGLAPTEKNTKDDYTYFKGYALLGDELLGDDAEDGQGQKQNRPAQQTGPQQKLNILFLQLYRRFLGLGPLFLVFLMGGALFLQPS